MNHSMVSPSFVWVILWKVESRGEMDVCVLGFYSLGRKEVHALEESIPDSNANLVAYQLNLVLLDWGQTYPRKSSLVVTVDHEPRRRVHISLKTMRNKWIPDLLRCSS